MFFKGLLKKIKEHPFITVAVIEILVLAAILVLPRLGHHTEYSYSGVELTGNSTPEMFIKKGSYKVTVHYTNDCGNDLYYFENRVEADNDYETGLRYDKNRTFNMYRTELTTNVWAIKDVEAFVFRVGAGYDGTLLDFTIERNYGDAAKAAVILLIILAIADYWAYCFVMASRGREEYAIRNKVFLILVATSLLLSLPLMIDYLINGHDLPFHLIRIEGIKQAFIDGSFPVRINRYALAEAGYVDPIFYPYFFLQIPALMRVAGITVMDAYKIFVFLVIFGGVCISYVSFKGVFKDRKAALIGMFLYNVAPYHLACLYSRGAVGEYLAYAFIPLVLWGSSLLLAEETDNTSLKKGSILLICGFTGIIQSHILSCEMVGVFLVFALVLYFKRFSKGKIFLSFVVSGVVTLLLNMWFILPFLLSFGMDFRVFNETSIYPHDQSLMWYQILGSRTELYGYSFSREGGIAGEMGISIGLALCIGVVIVLFEAFEIFKKREENKRNVRIMVSFAALSLLALWMVSDKFPWIGAEKVPVLGKILAMVQFPWRYLGIATLGLSVVIAAFFTVCKKASRYNVYVAVLLTVATWLSITNFESVIARTEHYEVYSAAGSFMLGNEEYIYGDFHSGDIYTGSQIADMRFEKRGDKYIYHVDNELEIPTVVDTHLSYYPYYRISDSNTKEQFLPTQNEYGCMSFTVPEGYVGDICISMPESKKWLFGDFITVITAVAILFVIINGRRRKSVEKDS